MKNLTSKITTTTATDPVHITTIHCSVVMFDLPLTFRNALSVSLGSWNGRIISLIVLLSSEKDLSSPFLLLYFSYFSHCLEDSMPKDIKGVPDSTTAWLVRQVSPPPRERWAVQYE